VVYNLRVFSDEVVQKKVGWACAVSFIGFSFRIHPPIFPDNQIFATVQAALASRRYGRRKGF
jgi:hypothetical protein